MNTHSQQASGEHRSRPEVDRSDLTILVPPVDIYEDETGLMLVADLPGVSKERLGVKVHGENLVIQGDISVPSPQGMELMYAEIPGSSYLRISPSAENLTRPKLRPI